MRQYSLLMEFVALLYWSDAKCWSQLNSTSLGTVDETTFIHSTYETFSEQPYARHLTGLWKFEGEQDKAGSSHYWAYSPVRKTLIF